MKFYRPIITIHSNGEDKKYRASFLLSRPNKLDERVLNFTNEAYVVAVCDLKANLDETYVVGTHFETFIFSPLYPVKYWCSKFFDGMRK